MSNSHRNLLKKNRFEISYAKKTAHTHTEINDFFSCQKNNNQKSNHLKQLPKLQSRSKKMQQADTSKFSICEGSAELSADARMSNKDLEAHVKHFHGRIAALERERARRNFIRILCWALSRVEFDEVDSEDEDYIEVEGRTPFLGLITMIFENVHKLPTEMKESLLHEWEEIKSFVTRDDKFIGLNFEECLQKLQK